jgi:hypothetical protein
MGERDTPLRFGIMCDRHGLARWQADVVRQVSQEDAMPVVWIMLEGTRQSGVSDPSMLWRLYRRYRLERVAPTQRLVGATDVLDHLPVVQCSAETVAGTVLQVDPADVEEIARHDLDFLLAFVPQRLSCAILTAPRYGVWMFRHGSEGAGVARASCFVEVRDRVSMVEARLQRMGPHPSEDEVLYRGWIRIAPHSYAETVEGAYRATIGWAGRICRELRQTGRLAESDQARSQRVDPQRARGQTVVRLGAVTVASFVVRQGYRKAVRVLRAMVRHEQWGVGIVDASIESFLKPDSVPPANWLPNPSSRHYVADPFGLPNGKSPVLLVEAFDYLRRRGHVATISPSQVNDIDLRPVFPPDGHMSYPYLFTWRGDVYCTPESCAQRNVTLWRAVDFPHKWERVCTLVDDFPAADPTIVRHEGLWYLFCTDDDLGTDSNLHVFYADDLTGPWHPHALNPVKTDARSARPAGTPFTVDGRMYRPAQDSSTRYGGALVVNEITALTPTTFHETVISQVAPDPNGPFPKGLHTLAAVGGATVIDGKRERLIPQSLIGRVRMSLEHATTGEFVTSLGRRSRRR